MKPLIGLLAILTISLAMTACGGSSSASTTAAGSVAISPTSASVNVNSTVQFTATVSNLSSTLVNWQVNSVQGGSSTTGTITTGGLYTAPSTVPSTNTVTVTAVAQSDSSVTASTTVTILPAAAITLNLSAASVLAGSSQPFTATVSGGGSIAVTWEVNGKIGGDPTTIGSITAGGVYIAPQIPPPGGTVTITAVSQADPTVTASATVTVLFSNFSLQNSYAFSLSGTITSTGGFFLRAGNLTADGQGHIIGGLEDFNAPSGVKQNVSFNGTYSIGPDGRGTMQICEPSNSSCTSPTSNFQIVVVSAQQAQIIEFDVSATANGEMDLQDTSAFTFSGLSGTYTFDFFGLSSTLAAESVVGQFSADGNGGISSGQLDVNNGGTLTNLPILNTSTYSISANGRGHVTIVTSSQTLSFSFYVVSAGRAKFIELDLLPVVGGDAFKQQLPPLGAWGVNSLNGDFVFQTAGSSTLAGITDAGRFTTDGNGNVVSGSGILDENNGGSVTSGTAFSGTYTLDASGRGTLTFSNNFTYIFYIVSTVKAVIQETDPSIVADGLLLGQQGGPFTLASLQGRYALNLNGLTAAGEEDFVGQLATDGAGNVKSGLLDINDFGGLLPAEPNSGTYGSVASNGRATMVLNPSTDNRNFVLYFVNSPSQGSQVFVMGTDSTRLATGSLYKQF
jgi:hypothetical protein